MKLDLAQFREMNGYREATARAVDPETIAKAFAYKKDFLKRFIAIGPSQIDQRLGDTLYYVTRKYDGEFAMFVYQNGEAVTINRSGRTRLGLPCVDEAARRLEQAGVAEAVLPAEIYADDADKRTRVHDLIHALSKKGDVKTLRLAFFDILELGGAPFRPDSYAETWERLVQWFGGGVLVKTVEMQEAHSNADVRDLYRRWVEEGTAEGLVVRSNLPFVFKIKPRHSVEGVVVGFTEGTGDQRKQARTFLIALMPSEGKYQIVVHVGGGMEDNLKRDMFERLKDKVIDTDYMETDSNHVAFQMVKPELVMEFSVRDVIYETPNGPVTNPVLRLEGDRYVVDQIVSGVSLIAPVFEQFRDDKRADYPDVRLTQIQEFASFEPEEIIERPQVAMKESRLLLRDVYTKTLGDKFMLQKYLVWKTNKEETGQYPAYVLYYTNYSSGRMEPLQREIRASSSEEQIMELYRRYLEENVRQGWSKYEPKEDSSPPPDVADVRPAEGTSTRRQQAHGQPTSASTSDRKQDSGQSSAPPAKIATRKSARTSAASTPPKKQTSSSRSAGNKRASTSRSSRS